MQRPAGFAGAFCIFPGDQRRGGASKCQRGRLCDRHVTAATQGETACSAAWSSVPGAAGAVPGTMP